MATTKLHVKIIPPSVEQMQKIADGYLSQYKGVDLNQSEIDEVKDKVVNDIMALFTFEMKPAD